MTEIKIEPDKLDSENRENLFLNGSTWVRADFHLHTRSDGQFSYESEPNQFCRDYVESLKNAGIRIGVITNHNKFNLQEFKALRKAARKEEIFLLPGLELSVKEGSNGVHTLIIFGDKWLENGNDYINQFLNVAFVGKVPEQYENENGRCNLSLADTVKKLDEFNRDYFLIFAHVEQNSGLWVAIEGGLFQELFQNEAVKARTLGFQKVRTHDVSDRACRTKVKNWLDGWYPAEVEGSDCKAIDEIGKGNECWLKVGDFTFEAVKFALFDWQNRTSLSSPLKISRSWVKCVSFEGGILDGQTIHFSPELNTLIGIRGSGKSSILETLRYVLDIPFGEKTNDIQYKQKLINHTLGSGGKAILEAVDRFGQTFKISRIMGEMPEIFVDGKLQPGISIKETIIDKPIYFGQRDLSNSGEGAEKDLVEKLVGEELKEIRYRIEAQKQVVAETCKLLGNTESIDEKLRDYQTRLENARFKLKIFEENGIQEKLQKQTDFSSDQRKIDQSIEDADRFMESLDSLIRQYEDDLSAHSLYESGHNQEFFNQYFESWQKLLTILKQLKECLVEARICVTELKLRKSTFEDVRINAAEEFAQIRRKIENEMKEQGKALDIEEFPGLLKTIEISKQMLQALVKEKTTGTELKARLVTELSLLNSLWHEEFQLIKKELDAVNENQTSLNIEAEFKGDKEAFLNYFQLFFKGSRLRATTFEELVQQFSDFHSIFKDFNSAKEVVGSSWETFVEYFKNNLADLLLWQVPNKFTILYRDKELKHHSIGQRASALILFVLSQNANDLIIIDQPEDDLDNQTIYEDVIKLICKLKPRTQFIFATHNANFPVLGDAEQIFSCRIIDDKLLLESGSIDSPAIQKEVVEIMEGGEDAFKRRKEIYHRWKSQN